MKHCSCFTTPAGRALLCVMVLLFTTNSSWAIFRLWTGNGGNANWSTAANWNPAGAPQDGDDLFFVDGTSRQSNVNNLSGRRFNSINFSGSTSVYNLSGNTVVLSNGVTCQLDNTLATVSLPITLPNDESFVGGDGILLLNGDVDLAGHTLTIQTTTNCLIGLGGVVKGTGDLDKRGRGGASFGGSSANTYAGSLFVYEGSFGLGKTSGNAVTGPLIIGDLNAFTSGYVTLNHNDQIADAARITLNHGSLDLNGWDEAGITMEAFFMVKKISFNAFVPVK